MINWEPSARGSSPSARSPVGATMITRLGTGSTGSLKVNVTSLGGVLITAPSAGSLSSSVACASAGVAGPAASRNPANTAPSRHPSTADRATRVRQMSTVPGVAFAVTMPTVTVPVSISFGQPALR